MLILTTTPKKKIHIGEHVTLTVLSVDNGQVRFGITAPKKIPIHREEIYNKIQMEKNT